MRDNASTAPATALPQNVPRRPNETELDQLARALTELGSYDPADAYWVARSAYVAVYDDYCTACPGYCGKLMSVVWDGGPSFFDVYTWQDGKLERSGREFDEKECYQCGAKNGTLCVNCWRDWSRKHSWPA